MKKNIIIAAGSGFLGNILETYLTDKGYNITILTRSPMKQNHVYWDAKQIGNWTKNLENTLAIINLTGKSVDCRYTKENKKVILSSRIDSTNVINLALI